VKSADLSEFLKRHVVAMNQPTTSVIERGKNSKFSIISSILDIKFI
jgi:hypothetical protein